MVDSDSFKSLIRTLNNTKKSMSRSTLGRRILVKHEALENYLIRLDLNSVFDPDPGDPGFLTDPDPIITLACIITAIVPNVQYHFDNWNSRIR